MISYNKMQACLEKVIIPSKGYGLVAKENIKSNTIIIKEKPAFMIPEDEYIFSEMFQLLYHVLTSDDNDKINEFYNLAPNEIFDHRFAKKKIKKELMNIKKLKGAYPRIIYNYFSNYDEDELILLCQKYMCNAFKFGDRGPAILFNGTILNHSCIPNTIYGVQDNEMHFMTVREIKKGEEITDSYINIKSNHKKRVKRLKKQYGFMCRCERCLGNENQFIELCQKIQETKDKINH